ncbi:hypothetical protein GE061_017044 [Apolygus lucorum]|uniref:26S proteasome non-ATPase regulatory subunit 14 n=2 Tax=Cimicomorpha TaxID=33354 RepID=A0A8S9XKK4_APOLU|nr:hypothetical protein GE061_017044 [Apolygus lucorum]
MVSKGELTTETPHFNPHGLGDPNDRSLRKVEVEVLIPKKMREKAKAEKCTSEVADFHACCKNNGVTLVLSCQKENQKMKDLLVSSIRRDKTWIMLKHGRAGVPMEVMGLMLGEFVDDYTVRVIDVFAMPQTGTGVSVEAVDPVFQAKMLDMLKQTGRPEMVVGWYHSHPGFGCWLSGVDINTQQSFEALSERAVAVVVDPIQSVKGKVVIDAFRLINPNMMVLGQEPRQTTSNLGHLQKPSVQALIHGLNRHYYSISINYRKNELEQKMLLNLHKKSWMDGLMLSDYAENCKINETTVSDMLELAKNYNKALEEEEKMTPEQLAIKNVGKQDPKRHLEEKVDVLMSSNIVQCLGAMLDTVVFK